MYRSHNPYHGPRRNPDERVVLVLSRVKQRLKALPHAQVYLDLFKRGFLGYEALTASLLAQSPPTATMPDDSDTDDLVGKLSRGLSALKR